jgi:hypothetical protein
MKDTIGRLPAVLGVLILVGASAFAQPFPNEAWTIDENGPALLQGPLVGYSNGTNKLDPVSGLVGWYYQLQGVPSIAGDVVLLEPPATNYSDVLRFDGTGGVYFFSELEFNEPNPDHADVPLLPPLVNPLFIQEVGPEGSNGVTYIPQPGQPGFDTSGYFPGIAYNIISDAVPEPQDAVLAVTGGGLLLASRRARRRTA